jgi:hypothetical protein
MKTLTITLLYALTAISILSGTARAHSWYPIECCHDNDCAPIVKEDHHTVTTSHGTVTVPQNFKPIRPSQDSKSHACIVNNKLICIFRPAGA